MNNRKQVLARLTALALSIAILMTGCAAPEKPSDAALSQSDREAAQPSGILVPSAEFMEIGFDLNSLHSYLISGTDLYYMEWRFLEELKDRQMTLNRTAIDGTGVPGIIAQEEPGELYIDAYYSDPEHSLYLFGRNKMQDGMQFYLKKLDENGKEVFCRYYESLPLGSEFLLTGFADGQGNSILQDAVRGTVCVFDEEGNFTGSDTTSMPRGKYADAGEKGLFLWDKDWDTSELILQRIRIGSGTLDEAQRFVLPQGITPDRYHHYTVLSGCGKGLLISTEQKLWQYDPDTGAYAHLLDWQAPSVNIDGTQIEHLEFEAQPDGTETASVLINAPMGVPVPELASITWVDQAYLPQRETVVVGVANPVSFERLVRSFNRSNQEYEVQFRQYDGAQLFSSLFSGGEDIPDVLDIRYIPSDLLVSKGLLEDLTPYFEESGVVGKSDLLEDVWDAGCVDGKMIGAVISFNIESLAANADTIPADGWTYDELFALDADYPDKRMLDFYFPNMVFRLFAEAGMDRFIDWEKNKCYFDSEEFIELLERIKGLQYEGKGNGEHKKVYFLDEEIRNFLDGEYLMRFDSYSSYYDYQSRMDQYGEKARPVGYPNAGGEPWYLISPNQQLAVYERSDCKDGAWAFIEFLLSTQQQSWYGEDHRGFPAREDAFNEFLARPYVRNGSMQGERYVEEYAQDLRFMTEHLHLSQDDRSEVGMIVYEELEPFFAGDKTAEVTAGIIQNRMQLYLNE